MVQALDVRPRWLVLKLKRGTQSTTTARANVRSKKQCLLAFAKDAANRNRPREPVHLPHSFFSTSTVNAEFFKREAKAKNSCKALSAKLAEKLGPGGRVLVHLLPFFSKNSAANALYLLTKQTANAIVRLAHLRPLDKLNGANSLVAAQIP